MNLISQGPMTRSCKHQLQRLCRLHRQQASHRYSPRLKIRRVDEDSEYAVCLTTCVPILLYCVVNMYTINFQ